MRIGLFGGTFNPIHNGHLKAVCEVQKGFALDKSYIIPSAIPPHKEQDSIVDAKDRIEMIRLAVSNSSDIMKSIIISDVELKRSGPSYSIDTVIHFKSIMPKDSQIYFILGLDAFLEIDTWKSYMDLFLLTIFIVITRFPAEQDDIFIMRKSLENYLQNRILLNYKYSDSQSCYVNDKRKPVFFFDVNPLNISSTKIREFINHGMSIKSLVPEKVEEFIKTKGLYL
ncbi:MAG: nicotinate (nicotinamide) nucleotide adenylyltransferase [Deltaproteobacteria bacterium]|nr:nicotinate (nicotinamide) nucleotide adenylyltransferase [Deltaproteobacteria bacterium]MBW2660647.1 nicotinate (nicotinamide) nucleotide adenylyltransferase [Deltaproteobacteria bacterium]